jgi:hypothetical protein
MKSLQDVEVLALGGDVGHDGVGVGCQERSADDRPLGVSPEALQSGEDTPADADYFGGALTLVLGCRQIMLMIVSFGCIGRLRCVVPFWLGWS